MSELQFSRTALLYGDEAVAHLHASRVAVFGVGGVGGFAVEALARAGIGQIILCDNDTVSESNLNRQIIALHSTIGRQKTDVMKERILDINPSADVDVRNCFFDADTADTFDFSSFDYVVDAIDTVSSKLLLIECAHRAGARIISSMGAGNKEHPEMLELTDISKTSVCPLARVVRQQLKKRGIDRLQVVYSRETPLVPQTVITENGRHLPGSVSFVPSAAGLMLAGAVIRYLTHSSSC